MADGKTKLFCYGVVWQCYGSQQIEVPIDYTIEQAKEYVEYMWDGLPLPKGEYLQDSDVPDFDGAEFIDRDKGESV